MNNALTARLAELGRELETARGDARTQALDHLAQVLQQLDAQGASTPAWAREALASATDAAVEDGFDNMPI